MAILGGIDDRVLANYSLVENSLVTRLYRHNPDFGIDGTGTGVFIARNFVLTATHVLARSSDGEIAPETYSSFRAQNINATLEQATSDGSNVTEIRDYVHDIDLNDPDAERLISQDLAVLEISGANGVANSDFIGLATLL